MPRPFGRDQDGRAPAAPPAGFLQALQLRMRHALTVPSSEQTGVPTEATRPVAVESRCPPAASLSGRAVALPCLLETWRRRIDGMDKDAPNETDRTHQRHHRHHRHHHNHNQHNQHNHRLPRCHRRREPADEEAALSPPEPGDRPVAVIEVGPPPPPCLLRELPKLLHPRLERQRACASLAGLWGTPSPPPSPPQGEELRRGSPAWRSRCHPYCRRGPTGGKP